MDLGAEQILRKMTDRIIHIKPFHDMQYCRSRPASGSSGPRNL